MCCEEMMRPLPKLKRYISICLWIILLVVIIAYTVLVYYSQLAGILETAAYDMRLTAREFAAAYKADPGAPLPVAARVTGYLGENSLPRWLVEEYELPGLGHNEIEVDDVEASVTDRPGDIFFIALAYHLHDGERFYLVKIYTEYDDLPDAFRYSERTEILILIFGIGFILIVFLAIRFLFKKVAGSIEVLSAWAVNLNREELENPRPGLKFREIDQLADLIETAVDDLHQAMTREHQFLRHASHELRTPIAVLRTNMDLLHRLNPEPPEKEKPVFQRMGRAVESMHILTETLLWLSRKEETMPEPERFDVGAMAEDLVRENRYLLAGKDVALVLDVIETPSFLPKIPCRIALGNLIRNAFQYTVQGRVVIRVAPDSVAVSNNHGEAPASRNTDYGFGLGLSLVAQICMRLGLKYETRETRGGYRASISWAEKI